ncbi:hypothetical protein EIP91_003292 [Steccherinum ochraceum]|uniref:Peptidase A1 domain-containing protein n=1 Tax=Steccherinum ochraceum TaxID=92696 RepID=A0A4R0RRI0_9APHY|nr:hypothetical protein EIP91_003292 [Steccherinum ochraceum]
MHPLDHLPLTLLAAVLFSVSWLDHSAVSAAPSASGPQIHQMELSRSCRQQRNATQWGEWVSYQRSRLAVKYDNETSVLAKRENGMNLLSDQNADSTYFGSLTAGTPPVSYNVILDTGSSDFWLATEEAFHENNVGTPGFNPSASSSYVPLNTPFSIKYGSGNAAGVLGKDTIQMAGFTVEDQVLAVVANMSENMLRTPVSGLLGLAFPNIATSHAVPFWLNVAAQPGFLDVALMGFHLTRYLDDVSARSSEPGGTFSFGAVNTSLYTGEIDYVDIPEDRVGYWLLELTGEYVTLSSPAYAAIDTGTTLVGGPADTIADIFSTIPGSAPGTGDYDGYYTYPCSTSVTISLRFGNSSIAWPISPVDFQLVQLDSETCVGALFEFKTGAGGPTWIVGDTFLKNVYSVFRAEPQPSVGFARLSPLAESMNGQGGALPTPTYAAGGAVVTAQDGLSRSGSVPAQSLPNLVLLFSSLLSMAWWTSF